MSRNHDSEHSLLGQTELAVIRRGCATEAAYIDRIWDIRYPEPAPKKKWPWNKKAFRSSLHEVINLNDHRSSK